MCQPRRHQKPSLGQLRRLPRQAMHRAGVSPRTIPTALFFFGPTDAPLAAFPFLCQFFRAGVATSFRFHIILHCICLANHSAVSQPHPTEGDKICCCIQAEGILAATEVCCAVCIPPCAGRCARRLFVLSRFFFCLHLSSFSSGRVILEK